MASDDLVVIATFADRIEADVARTALEAAGLEVIVRSDYAGGLRPAMTFSNGAQVIVRRADAATATQILKGATRPSE